MTDPKNTTSDRLTQIKDFLTLNRTATTIPFDPNCTKFPSRKEVPETPGAPKGAAWVWGKDDFIGRLNLLTPNRVAAASKEVRTGELVPVNLPLDTPTYPAFGREQFQHEIKVLVPDLLYDDKYSLNTQSGTQWDGFRHFSHLETGTFYNNTKAGDIEGPNANYKCSIHHWAAHGIAGRGVLLDYYSYAQKKGITFDHFSFHQISYEELYQCGKDQGINIRPQAQGGDIKVGDMLFVRSGWTVAYYSKSPEERKRLGLREHDPKPDSETRFAGLKQEDAMLDWLHDCYFATVAGDMPSFEAWPSQESYFLHEYILAFWGMPLGEMLDLEGLAKKCRERNRWFFFFTSAPANVFGGVSSHVNGTAIF